MESNFCIGIYSVFVFLSIMNMAVMRVSFELYQQR